MAFVLVAAQSVNTVKQVADGSDVGQLVQFGILGLIFMFIVMRKYLVPEWTLKHQADQYEARLADKDKQLAEANAQLAKSQADSETLRLALEAINLRFQGEIVPALVRFNMVAAEIVKHRGGSDGHDDER